MMDRIALVHSQPYAADKQNTDQQKLKQACQDFEAILLSYLMKGLRSTVQKSDLFGSGREEQMFQEMIDQEVCNQMARTQGVGLAEVLFNQLNGNSLPETLKPAVKVVEKYTESIGEDDKK